MLLPGEAACKKKCCINYKKIICKNTTGYPIFHIDCKGLNTQVIINLKTKDWQFKSVEKNKMPRYNSAGHSFILRLSFIFLQEENRPSKPWRAEMAGMATLLKLCHLFAPAYR